MRAVYSVIIQDSGEHASRRTLKQVQDIVHLVERSKDQKGQRIFDERTIERLFISPEGESLTAQLMAKASDIK